MLNSKLSTDILGKIWDLADMDKDGNLDKVEFSIVSTILTLFVFIVNIFIIEKFRLRFYIRKI